MFFEIIALAFENPLRTCDNQPSFLAHRNLESPAMPEPKRPTRGGVALRSPPRQSGRNSRTRGDATSKVAVANEPLEKALYSVHPAVLMIERWITTLPEKTGRGVDAWVAHIRKAGPQEIAACRRWLELQHQIGTKAAWWLAERALGDALVPAEETPASYLAACPGYVTHMFAGSKRALRPLHEELMIVAQSLGEEVRICPTKTCVPLYRRHLFAEIRPAASRRIELGVALGDEPFTARLADTGGRMKGKRITHLVTLASPFHY
jgi:hypothetical protein